MTVNKQLIFLKIKDGKFVTVRRLGSGLTLCAVEKQNEKMTGQRVWIVTKQTQMAFFFQRENYYCLAMVKNGKLELQNTRNITNPSSDQYWFEKENLGSSEHYGLRSVAQPHLYLCGPKENESKLALSRNNLHCVQVTDEKIE